MARTNLKQFKLTDKQCKWLYAKSVETMAPQSAIIRKMIDDEMNKKVKK